MKIVVVTGTRPDVIKQAPLYWEAKKRGHKTVLLHSNQHKLYHLFEGVYEDMALPPPYIINNSIFDSFLRLFSRFLSKTGKYAGVNATEAMESFVAKFVSPLGAQAKTTAKIIAGVSDFLKKNKADIVLVHGDTLTCKASAIAAYLSNVPVGHVEAGLRTFSREPYPEQGCTRTADAVSDLRFAATETNRRNLISEGFDKSSIFVVGNTVVDAAQWAAKKGGKSNTIKDYIEDGGDKLVYFSCHRKENLIHKDRFTNIARAAEKLSDEGYKVLWSIRPGTRVAISTYRLGVELGEHKNLTAISDIPNYTDIAALMSKCKLIITDSGSMQEEAAALHVPCVTLRYVTDRPESVEAGVNVLAPPRSVESIMRSVRYAIKNNNKMRQKKNPYGNGNSSKKILDIIEGSEGKMIKWCK